MSNWSVVGQTGNVIKKEKHWLVDIAENRYNPLTNEKESVIWFRCLSNFEPRIKKGDSVIAQGIFVPSKNENFPYMLLINHIGKIEIRGD